MYNMGYFYNAIRRDISIVRGDTMSFGFQIKGLEGQRPTDILFTCKENTEDNTPLFTCVLGESIKEAAYDPDKDLLTYIVRVRPDQTAGLDLGRYFYDLEMKVNGDIITLMIGRFSIEAEITSGTTPIPPVILDGDDIKYPIDDIPEDQKKKYTEYIISLIARGIQLTTSSEDKYTTAEMVAALEDIKNEIDAINDSIKEKTGATEDIPLSDMSEAIDAISTGSGDLLKLIENNSLSDRLNLVDNVIRTQATKILSGLFREKWINKINLSTIQTVGSYGFYACSASGREIKLPNCKVIEEYAFKDYSRSDDPIDTIDFSELETVGQYAFQRAKLQTRLILPKCKTIGNNAFQECPLSGIEAPLLESIGQNAFASVWWSSDINLPSVKTIGNYAFAHTTSRNFTIGANCTYIGNEIFWSQAGVTNLYVLATTPPTLASPFKNSNEGVQHIYVPAESVNAYKSASVWSNYASIIEAIPT